MHRTSSRYVGLVLSEGLKTRPLQVGQYMTVCRILETTGVPIEGDSSIVTGKLSSIRADAPAVAG